MNDLEPLVLEAQAAFAAAATPAALEDAKARFIGKSGRITEQLKALGALPVEEKKARGASINAAKQQIELALQLRRDALAQAELQRQLQAEALDVTLPGRGRGFGGVHPITRARERIEAIFGSMGFDVADGPEIETDWYSFTALNNPENHPARSMQDTFYVDVKDERGAWLNLRPHTSPMQIRYAQAHARRYAGASSMPDIRVIAPGRTYRVDNDAYPESDQGLESLRTFPVTGDPPKNWRGPYLRQVVPLDPWGRAYMYVSPGVANPNAYDLYSLGKDGKPGGSGEDMDFTSWNGAVITGRS